MSGHDVAAEAAQCWTLHHAGVSYRAISDELGLSLGTVANRLRAAATSERVAADTTDRATLRTREAMSLDRVGAALEIHMESAADPVPAARALIALSARRSRLLGLDAPTKIALETTPREANPSPEIAAAIKWAQRHSARGQARIRGESDPYPEDGDSPPESDDGVSDSAA